MRSFFFLICWLISSPIFAAELSSEKTQPSLLQQLQGKSLEWWDRIYQQMHLSPSDLEKIHKEAETILSSGPVETTDSAKEENSEYVQALKEVLELATEIPPNFSHELSTTHLTYKTITDIVNNKTKFPKTFISPELYEEVKKAAEAQLKSKYSDETEFKVAFKYLSDDDISIGVVKSSHPELQKRLDRLQKLYFNDIAEQTPNRSFQISTDPFLLAFRQLPQEKQLKLMRVALSQSALLPDQTYERNLHSEAVLESKITTTSFNHLLVKRLVYLYEPQKIFSDQELLLAVDSLLREPRTGISYNGIKFQHDYENKNLEDQVQSVLTLLLNQSNPTAFLDQLPADTKQLLRQNTNSESPESRIEWLDLLSLKLKEEFLADSSFEDYDLNPLLISSLARHRMSKIILGKANSEDMPIAILRSKVSPNEVALLCADTSASLVSNAEFSARVLRGNFSKTNSIKDSKSHLTPLIIELPNLKSKNQILIWQCGNEIYEIKVEGLGTEHKIPYPPKLNFAIAEQSKTFEALATFSILDHFSKASLEQFLVYLATKGYRPESVQEIADLKPAFENDFKKTDLYLPTAHALNLANFQIGYEKSTKVTLVREIDHPKLKGEKLKIRFSIYFPSIGGQGLEEVDLTRDELAQLLCARREVRNNPLAVVTMSCQTDKAPRGWMAAYARSIVDKNGQLKVAPETLTDIPFIVGADRGFDTNSNIALMSHIDYALDTLEMVAKGKSAEKVREFLASPRNPSHLQMVLKKLSPNAHAEDESSLYSSYKPICNTDQEELFILNNINEISAHILKEPEKKYSF